MATEKKQTFTAIKQTRARSIALFTAFLIAALLLEYVIVQSFINIGVTDTKTMTLTVPFIGDALSFTISPLFHIIPIGVVIVLLATWTYLTRHWVVKSQRPEAPRRPTPKPAKTQKLKRLRRIVKRVDNALASAWTKLGNTVLKSRVATYMGKRFGFAKTAVKRGIQTLLAFSALLLLFTALAYPQLIETAVVGFLRWNTSFHGFILATHYGAQALGQTLAPLGSLAAAVNSGILAASPGVRGFLAGFGALTQPLANLSLVDKYIVCQNLAAWLTALLVLAYRYLAPDLARLTRRR